MKTIALSLLLLSLLASKVGSVHHFTQSPQTAVIAGWNILGFDPIPDARAKRIATTIRKINPDLIVLTEVNPNDVPEKIVQELGAEYQAPIVLPQNAGVIQNIALIFKTGVSVSDAKLLPDTDLPEEAGSRQALAANVRIGNFDFILVGVQLKSGRSSSSRAKRTRQCKAIAEFITSAVAGNEKDVLVIGDYNKVPRTGNPDPAKFVPIAEFEKVVSESNSLKQGVSRQAAQEHVETQIRSANMPSSLREWGVALCSVNKPAFDAFIHRTKGMFNTLVARSSASAMPPGHHQADTLSAEERDVCRRMGITAEQFSKSKSFIDAAKG